MKKADGIVGKHCLIICTMPSATNAIIQECTFKSFPEKKKQYGINKRE